MTSRALLHALAPLLLAGVLAGCRGLPDQQVEKARALAERFDQEQEFLDERVAAFAEIERSAAFAFLAPYAERERWNERFSTARTELGRARIAYLDEVGPLLEADRPEDADKLAQTIGRVQAMLTAARKAAKYPAQRATFLEDVRNRAPELVAQAEKKRAEIEALVAGIGARTEKASADYPAKRDDLAGRVAPLLALEGEARASVDTARSELGRGREADYATLGDATVRVDEGASRAARYEKDLSEKIGELYRSYSKTLIDMREELQIEVGRTSWNNAYDFPRETDFIYPAVEVDPETFDALDALPDNAVLASYSRGWTGWSLSLRTEEALWKKLGVHPELSWPGSDDASEFWLAGSDARYFHRYELTEGDERKQGEWEEVSEEVYEANMDNLGMDIASKPFGLYEDEVLAQASPAGMAYVGNPAYGRWETDPSGRRRWSWAESFLFYHLMFGGRRHYYYYDDWDRWNRGYRGRRPYYGGPGADARYGTWGSDTRKSSRYQRTTFGRGGGFRSQDRSVRGAGSASRGGGPGRGGK